MADNNPMSGFYDSSDEEGREEAGSILDDPLYRQIQPSDVPPEGKWKLPAMYAIGSRGEERYYQIGFDGENVVTVSGQVNGTITPDYRKVEMNTRSKSLKEQAMVNAMYIYRKVHREKNFRPRGSEVKLIKKPMTGHLYKAAARARVPLTYPVAAEVKMDGNRGLFETNDQGEVMVRTRGGKYSNQFEHICKFVKELLIYFPCGTILDSEMYCHNMEREKITSACRTEKTEAAESKNMIAHVFDIILPDDPVYEERKKILNNGFNQYLSDYELQKEDVPIHIVEYVELSNEEEIMNFYQEALDNDYEGIVIKRMARGAQTKEQLDLCRYQSGGPKHTFYKLKPEEDEEGIIVGMESCRGRHTGCAKLIIADLRGNIISCVSDGTLDNRKRIYQEREKYIGKLYTYKFGRLSAKNVPIEPVGKGLRRPDDIEYQEMYRKIYQAHVDKNRCLCVMMEFRNCMCKTIIDTSEAGLEFLEELFGLNES
jgi:ATP-dependent DNA ligase